MINITTLIYYFCVCIVSMIISDHWSPSSWQWWVIILCVCIARTCGKEEGHK